VPAAYSPTTDYQLLRNEAEVAADEKAASDLADTWVTKHNPENSRLGMLLNKVKRHLRILMCPAAAAA
jgi:hypothetical protein